MIFQHEYDHLEGVLFVDHFNENDKQKAQSQLELLRNIYDTKGDVDDDNVGDGEIGGMKDERSIVEVLNSL